MLGHLNGPISHFMELIHQIQDTKIALERLNEIHGLENEEPSDAQLIPIEKPEGIVIDRVSFRYGGPYSAPVLNTISATLPKGSVTAIVGPSGSGKTTLLKLLLRFYNPTEGQICFGNTPIEQLSHQSLRKNFGVVMQDGYLFSDTIAKNICLGEDKISMTQLSNACQMANIAEFIETLPLRYQTRIGEDGLGLSQGQKQRILIARALYKNPHYLFFDEATSALDSQNEQEIVSHLEECFQGKTVVIIAHRLSTVKNADQILVLNQGYIVEKGTHQELVENKGFYKELIKNQLELGA
jgi:ATP-binding cassette subfamily B protein